MTNEALKAAFAERYGESGAPIRLFRAPGRVNLIGEHIDYSGGSVLPAALGMATTVAARRTGEPVIRLCATDLDDRVTIELRDVAAAKPLRWGNYQAGVVDEVMKAGYAAAGCDLLYDDGVPIGCGLSSSAAIEVATALALMTFACEDAGRAAPPDGVLLALIGQRAENNFVGVNCGIMDQFASAMGKRDCAILLDCATLKYEYVPLALGEYALVIGNTKKRRGLGDSKYNERRAECDMALRRIQLRRSDIQTLCDLTPADFETIREGIGSEVLEKRAQHAVNENARVAASVEALKRGDLETFGGLMSASHASLRDLYEVTGPELDAMVELARREAGVLGARMTGAGFGGCTVSLVRADTAERFVANVGKAYERATGIKPEFYISDAADGCREVY